MLVPPKLIFRPEIAPPPGTSPNELERVILRVTVANDGSVLDAKVEQGEEPWALAGLARANELRFEPATRNGAPISGIVRLEIHFTPTVVPAEIPVEAPVQPIRRRRPSGRSRCKASVRRSA